MKVYVLILQYETHKGYVTHEIKVCASKKIAGQKGDAWKEGGVFYPRTYTISATDLLMGSITE